MTKQIVFYHANCADGFGAAYSFWHRYRDTNAQYVPVKYGEIKSVNDVDLLGDIAGAEVYILDFSFPADVMEHIYKTALITTWLDHHKTAFEMHMPSLTLTPTSRVEEHEPGKHIVLDNSRSGALIAWEYFNPYQNVPDLISYIDDYDRWIFARENTKSYSRALRAMQPWSFEQWHEVHVGGQSTAVQMINLGNVLLDDHNNRVQSAFKHARQVLIQDGTHIFVGQAVNAPADIASDLGHELAKINDSFGLVYTLDQNMNVKCSFRSSGDYDVSAIAKRYGGGGHKNAAGAEISTAELFQILGHHHG